MGGYALLYVLYSTAREFLQTYSIFIKFLKTDMNMSVYNKADRNLLFIGCNGQVKR